MHFSQPSNETWQKLYAAVGRLKSLAPWKWMWDSDMVAVQDPAGNEVGYCVVLGRNGEFFGLDVSLGEEGLEGYARMQAGMVEPDDMDALHTKNCLLVSFEDRKYLDKNDLKIIRELGLTFRGRDEWPKFRHYEPGFFPWYVSEVQVIFLTHCLEQMIDVASRFKDNPDLLEPKGNCGYFTRVCKKQGRGIVWHDDWLHPQSLHRMVIVRNSVDEERINKAFNRAKQTGMIWEADYFWAPMPVREGKERPYYPATHMLSDHESYFVLDVQLESKNNHGAGMGNLLMRAVEKHKFYPKEIIFRRPNIGSALGYFGKRFDIRMKRVDQLKAIDDVRHGMSDFFKK